MIKKCSLVLLKAKNYVPTNFHKPGGTAMSTLRSFWHSDAMRWLLMVKSLSPQPNF
jgi:hypothetical protein